MRNGLGVGLAVGLSGFAFGAAASTAGLTAAQACVLSLLAFTGASQFALTGVIGAGGGLAAGVLGAVLLGGRNALYGLRLADLLRVRGARRLLTAHGVIDETTAVANAQPDRASARTGFYVTAATIYVTWNLTTLLGALGAARLGDPETYGLDVLGPAAFLALLWPRLTAGRTEARVAVGAGVIAIATTPLLPPGVPVMLAALAALVALLPYRPGRAARGRPAGTEGPEGTGGTEGTGGAEGAHGTEEAR
ncbi:AzlC family ABC transporter permease [Spirillospora sp. NPDC029432]|uniref:AzlC family ABC transporter permease n=1 Tax=Spirillospora sp. NPDC029432 TaxID=3154599 RepID=UPI003452FC9D